MARGVSTGSLIVAISLVVAAPSAAAETETPPIEDVSAIDQYRESVPTASGQRALGERRGRGEPLSLTARTRLRADGGADTELLEQLATSPAVGGPTESRASRPQAGLSDRSAGSTGSAVASVAAEDRGLTTTLILLLVGVGVAAVALRRRRSA